MIGCAGPRDAATVIADAQEALGNVTSITYSGTARDVAFQQCGANEQQMICEGPHDPMRPINNYQRVIDLNGPASRATGTTRNVGGGGSTAVVDGTFNQQIGADQIAVSAPWSQSVEFYLTPWGFLKGAAENNATVSQEMVDGATYDVLSWSPQVTAPSGANYTINGYVDGDNHVVRVETWLEDNIMGDMHIEATYSGWQDMGGAMVPTTIVQTRGGWPFFEVDVASAEPNPANVATLLVPEDTGKGKGKGGAPKGGGGPAPAIQVDVEELADGVWRLTTPGFSYDSLVVEFDDHIMMLEAGQSQERAVAYIAKAKELVPDKPITQVMNTHPHSDHTGGLPALVAEGATIITHENNEEFFLRALNTPRTLLDDTLSNNPMEATVDPVGDMKEYSDGTRTVVMYHVPGAPHSNGLLIAYLPQERILFQGDFSVNEGQPANDHVNALVPVLNDLGLDYNRYINVHASPEPQFRADVMQAYDMRQAQQ